ncbi:hypothetical protein CIG2463D_0997 [Campylobacter iguaniorum]|uniref:hypothetical protein n=1 Tax=Campylobacter iguaniorum TaxID=1244531 RepID=UPI00073A2268|nr:hypothetical protein [Campylobacter iguaniorum]ALV24570.1 hypothetical protein CIG2463D_0997 [Campylobacter iguaniorum]
MEINNSIMELKCDLTRVNMAIKEFEKNTTRLNDFSKLEIMVLNMDKTIENHIKREIWDIKQYIQKINQNEKDIAVLLQKLYGLEQILISNKSELEAKMATKEYVDEKKYKSLTLWISLIAILISVATIIIDFIKG